jgi:hypothetical protein
MGETQIFFHVIEQTNRGRCNLNVFTQGNHIFPHTLTKYTHRCSLFWLNCFTSSKLRCHIQTTSSLSCELRNTSHEVKSTTRPYGELQKSHILLPSIPDVTLQAHYFLFPLKTQFHFGSTLAVSLAIKIVWTGISDALCGYFRAAKVTLQTHVRTSYKQEFVHLFVCTDLNYLQQLTAPSSQL